MIRDLRWMTPPTKATLMEASIQAQMMLTSLLETLMLRTRMMLTPLKATHAKILTVKMHHRYQVMRLLPPLKMVSAVLNLSHLQMKSRQYPNLMRAQQQTQPTTMLTPQQIMLTYDEHD